VKVTITKDGKMKKYISIHSIRKVLIKKKDVLRLEGYKTKHEFPYFDIKAITIEL